MDPVGVNSIEIAALGRPFQLGMLYDCRRDALVPGIRLWSKEQLQQNINTKPQINTDFTVTASDSIEDKSRLLNIGGSLKLSLLGGIINVSGAAKFLKDTKKSFNQQRLTLHYHSTTEFKELIMNHFSSGDMAHYDDDVATHVVTAVLYGADACFVFDREVSSDEDKMEIAGEVKAAFKQLKGISAGAKVNLNDSLKTAGQKFSCTFYGDFQLPCNPTSFEEAMKVFEDLPKLLGENKELAVPLRVWLYPLDKLFSRVVKFQHEISTDLSSDIESVIESLSTTEMKCSDLLTDTPALTFTAFHDKINDMKKNCYQCRLSLMKKLGSLLPKIRGKFIEDTALIDLLHDHEESPFERSALEQWLKEKEEESDIIKTLLTQLDKLKAMVGNNLNKHLMHLEVKHLVIYTFTSLSWTDVLLSKQKAFLSSSTKGKNEEKTEHKTWLAPDNQNTMRNNMKVFKKLFDLNKSKSAKFIVASKEMEKHPGSCILLYENESNEPVCFTPPSKPDCPITEDVRCTQVDLKVSPACPATEELKLLYKMKEEEDWRSQTVSKNQNTVTLTDLRPDTEYNIKCAAVGKLNYTVDSDVTRLTVINQNLIKAKESAIKNLSWTENKCSVLLENTKETTFSALHKKIQDMRQNCQTYRQDFSDRIKSVIQSVKACEKESCALTDLLQAHDESPFNEKSLKEWMTVKEEELNTVNEILRHLMDFGAEVSKSLDSYLSDIQVENVLCYTFSSLEQPDEFLNEQEHYRNPQMMRNPQKKPDVASQSWLTGSIREKMREHLKIFKELMMSYKSQRTKFVVSIKDHEKYPGSCILLYENGSNEAVCFIPPSKPDCPITEDVRYRQVVLKVSPACPATEELKLLYKMKEEKDWRSQTVSKNQDKVTLTDLRPDTEYNIKCAAVGKLNYTVDSDVTRLTVINQNLIKAKESVIKNLSWTENKCSVLLENTRETSFSALHKKIQHMRQNCQTYRQEFSDRIKCVIQSVKACEKESCALTDLLQAHDESPFNEKSLKEWITVKEEELNTVNEILRQLMDFGAEVNRSLDSYLSDIQVENVFCYTFSSLEQPDELLNEQEHYRNPQMKRNPQKKPDVTSQSWLTGSIREKMREHLKIFKELMTSYKSQSTKFVVSIKDHEKYPGSCILLYTNGSNESVCFTSPSKPDCPIIEDVRYTQVVLKVSPACPATEELKLLYKMKEEEDWRSQTVSKNQDKVTLTDLRPDTEYNIKCAAVGKLNYTVDSDVTRLTVINKNLIKAKESVIKNLSWTENKCSVLLENTRETSFSALHKKIQHMRQNCQTYRQEFSDRIKSVIQSVKACEKGSCALTDLLQAHDESPFNEKSLKEWITVKEEELNTVNEILRQLMDFGAEVNRSLDSYLSDIQVENVFCYTFSSLEQPDELLNEQEHYRNPQMKRNPQKKPDVASQSWLTGSIREKMREHLKIFKELMMSYKNQSNKFVVSIKDHEKYPGSCILLYEDESNEAVCFTPPSKPDCPIIEDVRYRQVVLKVSPACPATEELKLLYKMKEEEDWRSQTVSKNQNTVTLTDLRPDTEYNIKCAAVGKLNYTVDSDVTRLRVINQNLIKAKESVIKNLSWTENKCSVLLENTMETTFSALHKKIQDMRQNCQTYRQDFSDRIKSVIQSVKACEKESCALTDLLQAHDESPFNEKSLKEWITVKEEELNTVNEILRQLMDFGAEVNRSLDSYLSDIQVENVFCYMFSSLEQPDELLNEQEHYRNPQMMRNPQKKPDVASQSWLTGSIREKMREHLKIFKELMTSYKSQSTKFVVSIKDHEKYPGSCIFLYTNGSNEAVCFTSPSKPDCPITEDVRCTQVVLKVSPACPATEELKLLYKMKEEKDWRSQTVSKNQNTVTLTDLRPDTEYNIKCAAVGKLNYTVDSDVTRLTVINQNLIKAKESVIKNLSWTENKCSVLLENTRETSFTALHKKIQHMRQNCQTYRQEFSDRIKSVIQSVKACEKESCALMDLLQAHDESPFNEKSLKEWITVKEEELNTVNEILRQLMDFGAEVNRSLDSYLSDIQVENVFCYTFSSLEQPDELLNEQEHYRNPQMKRNPQKKPDVMSQSWLTGSIREKMRGHLKIFKELMMSYKNQSNKFVVSIKDHEKHPGSCILLYEDESNEAVCFTPPSKPDCPITEDVRYRQVVLKVSPACPATEELKLLYKMKEEEDWRSQTVSKNQNTVTLTDLRPDTEYNIKCAAVGKLNYTVESDVTRLRVINQNLIKAKESAIKKLSWTENKCSVLLENTMETTFSALHKKIQDMRQNCQTYRQEFSDRIKSVIQSVKACEKESCALMDLLQAHDESPFNEKSLKEWITVKEEELNTVNEILRQLMDFGAEVNRSLDSYLSDIQVENVFCYTFSSLEQPDELLNEQEHYRNPQMKRNPQKKPDVASQSWLTGSIREKMREHLKIFKELMMSYKNQSNKFVVSIKDHEKYPGSCILLYEDESNEAVCFTPPSKPDCPIIEDVRYRQVVLKVSPACPATEELKLLYKMKEEEDWRSQTVSKNQNTVTLTDLRPDTEYNIKCAAVGKLNYTVDSDVTRLRVINQNLIKAKESVIKNLSWTENKCSVLLENTMETTFSALHKKIQDMRQNCQTYRQDFSDRIKSVIQSVKACEKESCALTDLLQAHDESPFNEKSLKEWITVKEEELNTVNEILRQLMDFGAEVNRSLDSYLSDIQVENVFCYMFSSLEQPDELLNEQEHYRNPQMMRNPQKKPDVASQSWLTGSIREKMREHLKIFKELMTSYKSQSTKFVVSIKDHEKYPGSCIFLYTNGSNEAVCFTSPSKPDCPITEDVRCTQVVLKVSPACPATEELKLLYKMKEEKDWRSQTVSKNQNTVTLTDLRPDTEYNIKCAAVGKLNYTVDSDVTRLTVINQNLIKAKESVIKNLSWTENKCSVLLENTRETSFTALHKKIQHMRQNCQTYRQEFSDRIKSVIQSVKACEKESCALMDLLQAHDESPFNEKSLKEWITVKEEELNTVNEILRQLMDFGAEVNRSLDSYLSDIQVENVFCYTFSSLEQPDELLNEQEHYRNPQMKRNPQKKPDVMSQSWLTGSIREKMRGHLKIFKELMMSYKNQSNKFVVSIKDHEKHPGSCILLYEDESNEAVCFTPPSKPDCPITEDVRYRQVVLKVSPACPATEELKLLYKMKEEEDWRSQTVSKNQNTVTLTDLRPDTEYNIKCAAVGKLNYTVESDVTRLRVINQNLIKAKESAIKKLSWTENKCSVLLENTMETTFSALHKKIQDMRQNCQTYRQEFSDRIKSVIQSVKACEKESCALMDLLQAHDESPFNEKSLKEWITVKEEELNTFNEILRQLMDFGAEVNRSLDSYLSDIQVENVFCYTFSSLEQPDELLNEQEHYRNPQMKRNPQKKPDVASQSWLTGSIREKMREHLKIFKELMMSYKSQSTKFVVSMKDHEKHPGSCILLYENESNESVCFTSPSKPDCPITEDVRCTQVDLKVSPACPATEELKLLYKMKEEKDWRPQTVSKNQNTVTLTDLRPDTEYNIKCAAVGKLNYITESDVTTVITKDINYLTRKSILIEDGNPARYHLQKKTGNLDQSKPYRKLNFGERDKNKPHKVILMVGETGTGKTTLINTMINYMLDVQREDKVWFEITDQSEHRSSAHSQTSIITVYGFYLQESPIHLTIINTPGYGNTCGIDLDKEIAENLLSLCKSEEEIHEIHAVCLVIKTTQTRLSDRQRYIFDAVQSLFGRDIAENIVLLFTHSRGAIPKNVKEAKIKCAVNDKNQPVFFLFDNCQEVTFHPECQMVQEKSWNLSFRGMTQLFQFLSIIQPKNLKMTQDVLKNQKQLEANINNLQSHVHMMELKQNKLKQTQEALEQNNDLVKNINFEYEVDVPYKEKVDIDPSVAKAATCCSVCKENCHYPGCWWISNLSQCSVMKNYHCTVCTKKCHYSKHVKEAKIYVTKTKKEKRTKDGLKKKYDGKIRVCVSLVKKLEEELQELQIKKVKLVFEAFHCVETLEMISLNSDSVFILQHIDLLIEKMKEINETEKAETLENIKKRAGEETQGALRYIKIIHNKYF